MVCIFEENCVWNQMKEFFLEEDERKTIVEALLISKIILKHHQYEVAKLTALLEKFDGERL